VNGEGYREILVAVPVYDAALPRGVGEVLRGALGKPHAGASQKTIRYAGSIFETAAPMAGNEAAPGIHPARARPLTSGGTGTGMFRPPPFHKPFHNGKRYPP
jgi:hypothetical protein